MTTAVELVCAGGSGPIETTTVADAPPCAVDVGALEVDGELPPARLFPPWFMLPIGLPPEAGEADIASAQPLSEPILAITPC